MSEQAQTHTGSPPVVPDAMRGLAPSTIAACFALAAFAVAIIAGMASKNPATVVLTRSILAMVICYPVGLGVGLVSQRIIHEHVQAHQDANPAPESGDASHDDAPVKSADSDEDVIVV